MSLLEQAIAGRQWDVAALCIYLGAVKAASALPPDAVVGLLEALESAGLPRRGRRNV